MSNEMHSTRTQFLDLPLEIHSTIFLDVLTTLEVASEELPLPLKPIRHGYLIEEFLQACSMDRSQQEPDYDAWLAGPFVPIHCIKNIPALLLVNWYISRIVRGMQWESLVQFVFPSTVALLDALLLPSQRHRLRFLRNVRFHGGVVNLAHRPGSMGDYTTYHAYSFFPLLTGLQLDVLEVSEPYLSSDDHGLGRIHLTTDLAEWLVTQGWREFRYLMDDPYIQYNDVAMLMARIDRLREDRSEDNFDLDLPTLPVIRDEKTGQITELDPEAPDFDEEHENFAWGFNRDEDDIEGARVIPRSIFRRGKEANYIQEEVDINETRVRDCVLNKVTWKEIRESGDYLMDDGTDNPAQHLY